MYPWLYLCNNFVDVELDADSGSAGHGCKLHICNGHISSNSESLNTTSGEMTALGVLCMISYLNVGTSKTLSVTLTAALAGKVHAGNGQCRELG